MKLRRLLAPILDPRWVISLMALAIGVMILSLCLTGSMHITRLAGFTLIQYGDSLVLGWHGHILIYSMRIWAVATVLALPGLGWALWFLIHLDASKAKA